MNEVYAIASGIAYPIGYSLSDGTVFVIFVSDYPQHTIRILKS